MGEQTPQVDATNVITAYDYHLDAQYPVRAYVSSKTRDIDTPRMDVHSSLEMGMMLDGMTRRYSGNQHRDIEPGDVWFCGSFERHGYKTLKVPCKSVVVFISPEFLYTMSCPENPDVEWISPFTMPFERRPSVHYDMRPEALMLGQRMAHYVDFATTNEVPPLLARLFVMEILFMLLARQKTWDARPLSNATEHVETGLSSTEHSQILPAIDMVLQSKRIVKIKEAAEACGMSRDRFLFHFHATTGTTFGQFVLKHRIHGATRDLLSTSRLVKAIARDWGFTDGSHLHKAFLKHYGKSPGDIRAAIDDQK